MHCHFHNNVTFRRLKIYSDRVSESRKLYCYSAMQPGLLGEAAVLNGKMSG